MSEVDSAHSDDGSHARRDPARASTYWPKRTPVLAAGGLLALVPFTSFALPQSASLWQVDVWLVCGLLGLAGVVVAALAELAGVAGRVVCVAGLATLAVDVASARVEPGWILVAAFVVSLVIGWVLRAHLGPIVSVAMLGALAASFFSLDREAVTPQGGTGDSSLPPVLHILLDEHTAVEGIPRDYDPAGDAARALRHFYLARGFRVFGRAVSRHPDTAESLSATFNSTPLAEIDTSVRPHRLVANAYFEEMLRRGYRMRIHQTDYLDLCPIPSPRLQCVTHGLETPRAVAESGRPLQARIFSLLAMYSRLSWLIPNRRYTRVAPFSGLRLLDTVVEEAASLEPGNLLFAHVALPHYPYVFDERCKTVTGQRDWPPYAPYLRQIVCVHSRLGALFDQLAATGQLSAMQVIVHGDHGARISFLRSDARHLERMGAGDIVDAFATLFAARTTSLERGYDRRILPLDQLLAAAIGLRPLPSGDAEEVRPDVYLRFAREGIPMVDFDAETPGPERFRIR